MLSLLLLLPLGASAGLREFVAEKLTAGEKNIVIAPGRHELAPERGVHWVLEGLSDVTIDAAGAELVCTETTQAISIRSCTNLTIRGLTIDYDPLPFTQGRIVEISADRKSHIIEIMDGFPAAESAYAFKYEIFTAAGTLRFGDYYRFTTEVLPGNRLKIDILQPHRDGGEQVGDIVVLASKHCSGRYIPHAVMLQHSVGTLLENVTIYSSPCFGFYEDQCKGSVYRDCTIDRRTGRMRSLNADAFHSKSAAVGPQIIGCRAMWQGDDCVNICGDYHLIVSTSGRTLRVLAKRRMDIEPGDAVELVAADGRRLPDAVVLSITPLADLSVDLSGVQILPKARNALKKAYEIELTREVELPVGSVIASLKHKGNGFAVKNCTFGHNRSRGIIVKASDGEISGNHLEDCRMDAIKVSPEVNWLESGFSRNLAIRGNVLLTDAARPVYINGLDGGLIESNTVTRLNGEQIAQPFHLSNCTDITLQQARTDPE